MMDTIGASRNSASIDEPQPSDHVTREDLDGAQRKAQWDLELTLHRYMRTIEGKRQFDNKMLTDLLRRICLLMKLFMLACQVTIGAIIMNLFLDTVILEKVNIVYKTHIVMGFSAAAWGVGLPLIIYNWAMLYQKIQEVSKSQIFRWRIMLEARNARRLRMEEEAVEPENVGQIQGSEEGQGEGEVNNLVIEDEAEDVHPIDELHL